VPIRAMPVLVVEDNASDVGVIREAIAESAIECALTVCSRGDQGLAALAAHDFELVFLDLMLPVVNGFDFLKSARSSPHSAGVPIAAMSGGDAEWLARARECGATYTLQKPSDLDEYIEALIRIVRSARENRTNDSQG